MKPHTVTQFDNELEQLRTAILKMGGTVEEMVKLSAQGFAEADIAKLRQVFDLEAQVNTMEVQIDEMSNSLIARMQPLAYDLRLIVTAMKMVRDLERAGDEAEKMARMATKYLESSATAIGPRINFSAMANHIRAMLDRSLDAYAREDASAVEEIIFEDKEVDEHFRNTIRLLISYVVEDSRTISRAIDLLFFAKAMERIGDHAKNMAEHVAFLVRGQDLRHKGDAQA